MQSMEDFVALHGQGLFRLAFLLAGSRDAAEDLYQDTMVKVHKKWRRVVAADQPSVYVRRIMVNTFTSSRRARSTSEIPTDLASRDSPVAANAPDVASTVVERDSMWRLLATLPRAERAALVLRYYEDLSDRDAAQTLGCRPSTVRANTSRALARLRAHHLSDGWVGP